MTEELYGDDANVYYFGKDGKLGCIILPKDPDKAQGILTTIIMEMSIQFHNAREINELRRVSKRN